MGTVEAGFDSSALGEHLIGRVRRQVGSTDIRREKHPYRFGAKAYIDGKYIAITWGPKPYKNRPPYYRLQFHMSHFATIGEMWSWLAGICGPHFSHILRAKVMRLDCYVDVQLPLSFIRESLHYKRGRSWSVYKNSKGQKGESIEWGSTTLKTRTYSKKIRRNRCHYLDQSGSHNSDDDEIDVVRIEAQFRRRKLPFRFLGELEMLKSIYPFDHLKIFSLGEFISHDAPHSIKIQWEAAKSLSAQMNLTAARQYMNKSRNLSRTLDPYIVRINPENFLTDAWRDHVQKFFMEDAKPSFKAMISLSEFRSSLRNQRSEDLPH